MAYFGFVSYARVNADRSDAADPLRKFAKDIRRRIEQRPDLLGNDEPMFFDETNIETGRDWDEELSHAAATSRVAMAIYSPAYFTRDYCGREFQVFLDRRGRAGIPRPLAIVPVIWQPCRIPAPADSVQWNDSSFPAAPFPGNYGTDGVEVLSRLERKSEYEQAVIAIATRILEAAKASLPALPALNLRNYPAAWGVPGSAAPPSRSDALRITRFVFLSGQGWDWRPYMNEDSIGLVAQDVAVKLKVKFEEIPCDPNLHDTLDRTEDTGIPTLLVPDPSSVQDATIRAEMESYDRRLYDHCGLVVPWDVPSPTTDNRWQQIQNICRRKTQAVLPNHEWTSAVSRELFAAKAMAMVEGMRLKCLNSILVSGGNFAKAENETVSNAAKQSGVNLNAAPQVSNVSSKTEARA